MWKSTLPIVCSLHLFHLNPLIQLFYHLPATQKGHQDVFCVTNIIYRAEHLHNLQCAKRRVTCARAHLIIIIMIMITITITITIMVMIMIMIMIIIMIMIMSMSPYIPYGTYR